MVCVCLSYHGVDVDPVLVLAPVPLRRLQVCPRAFVASSDEVVLTVFMKNSHLLQPAEDMGLRENPVRAGANGVQSDPGRISAFGSDELRRDERPGPLHPHGGAVVHPGPTFHGRLGHPPL